MTEIIDSQLSSKNNVNPKLWGPYFWKVLHVTSYGYPNNPSASDKETYKQFIINFMRILPCDKCSHDAKNKVYMYTDSEWETLLSNRDNIMRWTYDFHDEVNKKLKKTSITFDEYNKVYFTEENFTLNGLVCNTKTERLIIVSLILVIVILLIMHYT